VIRVESPVQISRSCQLWIGSVPELPTAFPEEESGTPAVHLLSLAERDRLRRYRVPQKKWQLLLSRIFASEVLSRHFGVAEVRLESLPGGQPILCGTAFAERCSVSLSHSDRLFAMAIGTEGTAVGVDIESADQQNVSVLQLLLPRSGEDHERISEGRDANQLRMEWTGREALWKAFGGPVDYTVLQMPVVADPTGLSFCGGQSDSMKTQVGLFGFQSGIPSLSQSALPIKLSTEPDQSFCGCVVELRRMGSRKSGQVASYGCSIPVSFTAD
jgi:phosphopantetheinyl transferase